MESSFNEEELPRPTSENPGQDNEEQDLPLEGEEEDFLDEDDEELDEEQEDESDEA